MTDVSMLEARIQALEARVDALASGSTSSGGDGVGDGVGFVASGLGEPPLVPIGYRGGGFEWLGPDGDKGGVGVGFFLWARRWFEVPATAPSGDGYYYLKITGDGLIEPPLGVVVNNGQQRWPTSTSSVTCIPLFLITDGQVEIDARGAVSIAVWE